jgi:ubiquinone/menaquinone biosynthesis C-methylase UbiE
MTTPWKQFYKEKVTKIFSDKETVIDIGGGLRVLKEKNNRYDPSHEWIRPLLEKVNYKIMDPVKDYNPDIVGDIHHMPFQDDSLDAIICLAVLEHVENPIQAWQELYRALKPGGYVFIYVPFLYYYHAEKGYYKDYWRFTRDTIDMLSRRFAFKEVQSVRGALGTWMRIGPLGRFKIIEKLAYVFDHVSGKLKTSQVSGHYVFLIK